MLTLEDLEAVEREAQSDGSPVVHPMCKTYEMGLLGAVTVPPGTRQAIQRFEFAKAGKAGAASSPLPNDAALFVTHPMLARLCGRGTSMRSIAAGAGESRSAFEHAEGCPIGNGLVWDDGPRKLSAHVVLKRLPEPSVLVIDGTSLITGTRKKGKSPNRTSNAKSRPYILLLAWIVTMARKNSNSVNFSDVVASVRTLKEQGVIPARLNVATPGPARGSDAKVRHNGASRKAQKKGARKTSREVDAVMADWLDGAPDHHDGLRDIRRFVQHLHDEDATFIRYRDDKLWSNVLVPAAINIEWPEPLANAD